MRTVRWLAAVVVGAVASAVAPAAEDSFSKSVAATEFSAAGLAKLSPEELRRLDDLVRDYKSGALEAARRDAAKAAEARVKAEAKAARAEAAVRAAATETRNRPAETVEKRNDPSLLSRGKVLLTPG